MLALRVDGGLALGLGRGVARAVVRGPGGGRDSRSVPAGVVAAGHGAALDAALVPAAHDAEVALLAPIGVPTAQWGGDEATQSDNQPTD